MHRHELEGHEVGHSALPPPKAASAVFSFRLPQCPGVTHPTPTPLRGRSLASARQPNGPIRTRHGRLGGATGGLPAVVLVSPLGGLVCSFGAPDCHQWRFQ